MSWSLCSLQPVINFSPVLYPILPTSTIKPLSGHVTCKSESVLLAILKSVD